MYYTNQTEIYINPDRIPSAEECYKIMTSQMLPNIFEHSKQVMNVASTILDNLKNDININKPLVIAASLLHDITKTNSLKTMERHDVTGGQFSREHGFFNVANIIEQHIYLKDFKPDGKLEEREIVFYADKRVKHKSIVTIKERMDDLAERYGFTPEIKEKIIKHTDFIIKIENKINYFLKIDIQRLVLFQ